MPWHLQLDVICVKLLQNRLINVVLKLAKVIFYVSLRGYEKIKAQFYLIININVSPTDMS